jgi:hypothetical protein
MMEHQEPTRLSRLLPLGLLLASATACVLPVQQLDSGGDGQDTDTGDAGTGTDTGTDTGGESETSGDPNDPNAECLLGSLRDTVGTNTEYWSPPCSVVCEEGWAHGDAPLDIAWTLVLDDSDGQPLHPAGLVTRENGEPLAVGFTEDGRVLAQAVDANAQLDGQIEVPLLPTEVKIVQMWGTRLYLLHHSIDDMTSLTVFDDNGASPVAGRDYGLGPTPVLDFDVSDLGVVVLYEDEDGDHVVELLTHDLQPKWSEPVLDGSTEIALGGTPESAIVLASTTASTVEALDGNGSSSWSTILTGGFNGTGDMLFMGPRLFLSGATLEGNRFNGAITGMIPDSDIWYRTYGRASSWCPDENDTEFDDDTADFFGDLAVLDDGTLLLAGTEAYEGQGLVGNQPLVVRLSADAEFLGRDRGLWQGYTTSVLAGPNQTGLMLAADEELGQMILRAYNL